MTHPQLFFLSPYWTHHSVQSGKSRWTLHLHLAVITSNKFSLTFSCHCTAAAWLHTGSLWLCLRKHCRDMTCLLLVSACHSQTVCKSDVSLPGRTAGMFKVFTYYNMKPRCRLALWLLSVMMNAACSLDSECMFFIEILLLHTWTHDPGI